MSEPTYTYVKGEGWVIRPEIIVKTKDGVRVRVELRKPIEGEYFFYGYADKDMQRNLRHVTEVCTIAKLPMWGERHWREFDETRDSHVVLIPV